MTVKELFVERRCFNEYFLDTDTAGLKQKRERSHIRFLGIILFAAVLLFSYKFYMVTVLRHGNFCRVAAHGKNKVEDDLCTVYKEPIGQACCRL